MARRKAPSTNMCVIDPKQSAACLISAHRSPNRAVTIINPYRAMAERSEGWNSLADLDLSDKEKSK